MAKEKFPTAAAFLPRKPTLEALRSAAAQCRGCDLWSDEALIAAGIDKSNVYITNAVKHFNWAPDQRGKRRIHKKPRYSEIQACRPWLDAEIALTRPRVIICLGATAAQALLGKEFSVMRQRGKFVPSSLAPRVMATVHPSSILRAQDDESRREQKQTFIGDLRIAAREIHRLSRAA